MSVNRQTLRLYWQHISRHRPSFFAMLICIPLASLLLDTALPYLLSQAVGTFGGDEGVKLPYLLIGAGIAGVVGVTFNTIGYQSAIHHESKVRAELVESILSRILAKDYAFFAEQKIGALTGKFIDFINAHVSLQDLFISRTLTFALNMSIGIIIILTQSSLLGLVVFGLLALILVQVRVSIKLRAPLRNTRKRLIGELNGSLADTISNNLTVKTFANEEYEINQSQSLAEKYRVAYSKDFRWMSTEGSLRLLLMAAVQIIAIIIMAQLLERGDISLGIAIFVVAYLQRIASQLFTLGEIINGYDKFFLQAAPMTEIIVSDSSIQDKSSRELTVAKGEIAIDNISYSYDGTDKPAVIHDLSLKVMAGERIGLVGQSGAGKTTLTKLLLRFDDVNTGSISIDGQNIDSITQASLRKSIAYVPQEPLLFHRKLRENILYGNLEASHEQLRAAAHQAHALEFIDRLPEGFDTIVGERGVKLSGGQRQRIAIARAILKDAPILILDEATSALDSESEKLIQKALDQLMSDRTSIVIAHRLSTIQKMDRIIVMSDGKITESGTHKELVAKNGTYAGLWSHQSGGFIEE